MNNTFTVCWIVTFVLCFTGSGLVANEASAQEIGDATPSSEVVGVDQTTTEPEAAPVPWTRPGYRVPRYAEDWSTMAARPDDAPADFFDPIKWITIHREPDIHLTLGGQYRFRVEGWNNFGFDGDQNDVFTLHRLGLHGDLRLEEAVRFFVELKSSHATERNLPGGRRVLDVDTFALQNAFADLRVPLGDSAAFTLRVGRQEMLLGSQRLVSPLDWSNTRRTFDAISGILEGPGFAFTGFLSRPVEISKYEFNTTDNSRDFCGVHGRFDIPGSNFKAEGYWFGLYENEATFAGVTGEHQRHTLGARLHGPIGDSGFDVDVESAYQFGTLGDSDISAWMLASQIGYRFADADWRPRVFVGFDYASGTRGSGSTIETFDHLFPLGHAYLGWADILGRQNIIAVNPGISLHPDARWDIIASVHLFWRASGDDGPYNLAGARFRDPAASGSRYLGTEFDLLVRYRATENLTLEAGYCRFFPGAFIRESGPGRGLDFFYLQVAFTF
ncbi:MAG: alginate export family protein [Phycisphaeraceae bacterium]|nr:alginate export family protein [Phycisphaeraceae bacterium]